MRQSILKALSAIILWTIVILLYGLGSVVLFKIHFNSIYGIIASGLSVVAPSVFDVGTSDWDGASLIDKCTPIITLLAYIVAMSLLGQSYITVIVNSAFLGFLFAYVGKIIDSEM